MKEVYKNHYFFKLYAAVRLSAWVSGQRYRRLQSPSPVSFPLAALGLIKFTGVYDAVERLRELERDQHFVTVALYGTV